MSLSSPIDNWAAAESYERFMGRWSRAVARRFLGWLGPQPKASWLEVGCGTGALTETILQVSDPAAVLAVEPSEALVGIARRLILDRRVTFQQGAAEDIASGPNRFQWAVSGLVLNFVGDPGAHLSMLAGMVADGGVISAYVWDYSKEMEFLRIFWDEAVAFDPNAASLDEGNRFPICAPGPLHRLFSSCGLRNVDTVGLEIETAFGDFSDYWEPFLGGIGPAPSYVSSLSNEDRDRLAARLRDKLNPDGTGRIKLKAKAWAVRGTV